VTLLWVKPHLGIFDIRKELVALLFIPAGLGLGQAIQWAYQAWQGAGPMAGH
jgi:hypothetical protein